MACAQSRVVAGVVLSHPGRVLYPGPEPTGGGLTKGGLADYFMTVAAPLLAHAARRPLSLVRCPDGAGRDCFFQRHKTASLPDAFRAIAIRERSGATADYVFIEDAAALATCAQIGALELHLWGAHVDDVDRPDRLVLDLDPAPDVGFDAVRDAARRLRDLLGAVGLESFALLTGGKGIHVVAPLAPSGDWPTLKAFARGLAEAVAAAEPARFTAQAAKVKRPGKIFIDWMRNERGASAIAPFSPRARPGAPVATPLGWDELDAAGSGHAFDVQSLPQRLMSLGRDPWAGYFELRQQLPRDALAIAGAAVRRRAGPA